MTSQPDVTVEPRRCLEDFRPGGVLHHWPGRTVTESDDHLFCLLTMSHHPLHIDRVVAETSSVQGRGVVLGVHVLALVLGLSSRDLAGEAIANLGMEDVRHPAPLFHGATLYASSTVLDARAASRGDRGVVRIESRGVDQDGTVVCAVRRSLLVWSRGGRPPLHHPAGDVWTNDAASAATSGSGSA